MGRPTAAKPETALVVAEPKPITLIREELEKRQTDLIAVLPPGMDPQRFARVSLLAVSKNPDLLTCTPGSIIRSVIEAAEIGLEPTGSLNRAWLVGFKNSDTGKKEAQLMIGYQGYADLMRGTGKIRRVVAEVVFEGDHFRVVKGTEEPRIEHEPAFATEDPSKITHAYAIAWFADGTSQFEVMTRQQIELVRAKSRMKNGPAWTQGYPQMCRKSVLRRLSNYVPLDTKAQEAIQRDDEHEYGAEAAPVVRVSRTADVRRQLAEKAGRVPAQDAPRDDETPSAQKSASEESAGQQTGETDGDAAVSAETVCGATSDPTLGEVETCVLAPDHLEGENAPQTHQGASGSVWPAKKGGAK